MSSERTTDLWPWYKEMLATVEVALVDKQAGARPRLELMLREADTDFRNLLQNPTPSQVDADSLKKAVVDGIKLAGQDSTTTLSNTLVEEAIIVADLFKLNELSSLQLLLHGEEQLPQYPGLTRGLVAVILYYDGRKAVVQALRTLMAGRPGLTWSSDAPQEITDLVTEATNSLMAGGLTDTILTLLGSLDWTLDLAGLQKNAALGDPQHVHTVQLLHQDIRQNLADSIYCYSAQSGLSTKAVLRLLDHLSRTTPSTATGQLDDVTAALLMGCMASFDVSCSGREDGEEMPLVADRDFIAAVSRELEGRGGRKWENPALLAVLQFAWSMSLAGLRTGTVGVPHAASHLEEDEMFMDLALEGKVFHHLPSLVLSSPSFQKEEFYQRRLHTVVTDFLTLMPLKIKELRNRADDSARNALMHEQEGIQYTVPLSGQHFAQILATVSHLYQGDKLDLILADLYWCPTESSGAADLRHCPAKQVALYKFVRLAGDLLMPSLYVPYVTMLTGLADTPNAAPHCFSLLKLNGSGSSNVSLDHFFSSLSQYHTNLQQVAPHAGPDHTIYRTVPLNKGISPQEIAGLTSVLGLVTVLASRCDQARIAMAEHPGWSVVPTVLGLLSCSVPTQVKAKLVEFLAALAKTPDIVHPLWQAIESAQLVASLGARPGLVGELEEIETRAEEFPLTRSFLQLLDRLTDVEIPGALGAGTRQPGFLPYLTFIQDHVFLKFQTRTYKNQGEKWAIAASCLELLHKLVREYEPSSEDFQGANSNVGLPPGFCILSHLHQTSLLLRTVLYVLDEARVMLDSFTPFPGKSSLESAATAALKLLQTSLRLSDSFISAGRDAGASAVLTTLPQLLLGLNPRTGRPDHMLNMAKYVLYGYWLPQARLSAVHIIRAVAVCPAHQAALLATLTATPAIANMVLKAFTDALDAEEEDEVDVPGAAMEETSLTRLAILDLLQNGLNMAAPSLSHFLLGFDLKKGVSRSQLQSPHVVGVRTPLHTILSLLSPAEPGVPTPTLVTNPQLVTASYRLIFTLVSHPLTSEPTLRFLRSSSSFLLSQLATITSLLSSPSVQSQRSAAWLLRSIAVESRVLAAARQSSQLAKILGLLLDASESQEDTDLTTMNTSLYPDNTFSQLSRTMAQSQTRQLDTPVSNHRLAAILNTIDFEMESLSAPTWELFDDSQVASVLEQCQVTNMDSSAHELLIAVPRLHKILAVELSTIQGSAAMNQRAMIQSEIQSILHYAVQWNSVQEGAAARRDLLDSWRQVAETLISLAPADLLSSSSKQQILLQLLQTLLNKVSGENPVAGLDTLVSSTVLLLLTALRQTYSGAPDKQAIMGETFVGLLDTTTMETTSEQVYSASLQVVLRGLISWILSAGAGSQAIRTNLYAALLAYLRIGQVAGGEVGHTMELSERGKLQKANLEVVLSYGTNFLDILSRDATTGHEVRRMLALAVLDELVVLDRQAATIRFLANQGFLKHIIESLISDEPGLTDLLTKPAGNIRYLYVFESKINLLVRVASNPVGADLLLQAGLMARLAEFNVLDLRPDPDSSLLRGGEEEGGSLHKYQSVLFPVLRLCQAVLASLGADNVSAAAQTVQFLTGHEEIVSLILRGSAARASLHPLLLQELALLTAVVSRAAVLDIRQDQMDASTIELQGQLSRMQKQMLSLLHQFQLSDSLVAALQGASPLKTPSATLMVLQIISNVTSFARSLVVSSSPSPRSTRLIVSPSLLEATEGLSEGPVSSRPASLGLLILTTRTVAAQLARSQASLNDYQSRLSSLQSLPITELVRLAEIPPTEKLPTVVVRKMANEKLFATISNKTREVSLCSGAVEGLTFLVWRHLEHYLLYSTAASTAGPNTPFQHAFSKHNSSVQEIGGTQATHRTAFAKVDLERLKKDVISVLNDTFFDKLGDIVGSVEASANSKAGAAGFLNSVLRRTKRLAALHTQ